MKRILVTAMVLTACVTTRAQSSEDGAKQLYYERYASAEKSFRQAVLQDPADGDAWFGLARALVLQEKKDEAANQFWSAPEGARDEAMFQAAYGYVMLAQDKKDSASNYFNEALDRTRHKKVGVLLAVAQAQVENKGGDPAYAQQLIEKAKKRDKDNPAIFVLSGDAFLKAGDGSSAYQAYNEALQHNSVYAPALHKLGKIFLAQKNPSLYLQYFMRAANADAAYAPSLYQLYAYYFYYDASKALDYFNKYVAASDPSIERDYDLADVQYLNKEYDKAISTAGKIISTVTASEVKPRIFKLLAYSFAGLKDSVKATDYMHRYFAQEEDSNLLAKDYELMAYLSASAGTDSSAYYLVKAASIEKDTVAVYDYYKQLASLAKAQKDYAAQAKWNEKYYVGNEKATNVDLFNWGLAHYLAQQYKPADSVFGLYVSKYPEQSFGYYWQAKANVALDQEMTEGLAVPRYLKLVEVLQTDTTNANYKKWMTEAFGYLAAYEANTNKNYDGAIGYFEKVLEVDPENESAKKYIAILRKDVDAESGTTPETDPGTETESMK